MQFTTLAISLFAAASAVVAAPLERSSSSGQATYFYQGGNRGACGNYNSDDAHIVAVNLAQYKQSLCGQKVWVTHGGKTIECTVADDCPTCGYGSLDLSVGVFQSLADMNLGKVGISWTM